MPKPDKRDVMIDFKTYVEPTARKKKRLFPDESVQKAKSNLWRRRQSLTLEDASTAASAHVGPLPPPPIPQPPLLPGVLAMEQPQQQQQQQPQPSQSQPPVDMEEIESEDENEIWEEGQVEEEDD